MLMSRVPGRPWRCKRRITLLKRRTTKWAEWTIVRIRAPRRLQRLRRPPRLPPLPDMLSQVVPPWGSQTSPNGTNISVYPGGTTNYNSAGRWTPYNHTSWIGGRIKTHGSVIARQVRPNGSIVQIYEDGFYSVTRSGTTTFSSKSIW